MNTTVSTVQVWEVGTGEQERFEKARVAAVARPEAQAPTVFTQPASACLGLISLPHSDLLERSTDFDGVLFNFIFLAGSTT